jgi:Holliday junction resolvase RusA-like endonuclease
MSSNAPNSQPDLFTKHERAFIQAIERPFDDTKPRIIKQLIPTVMLPMPPSINAYWGQRVVFKAGSKPMAIKYRTHEASAYIETIKEKFLQAGLTPVSRGALLLEMVFCFRDLRAADVDNRIKPLQDALKEAHLMLDDCQVWDLRASRGPVMKGGRAVVNIWEIDPDPVGALARTGWGR